MLTTIETTAELAAAIDIHCADVGEPCVIEVGRIAYLVTAPAHVVRYVYRIHGIPATV